MTIPIVTQDQSESKPQTLNERLAHDAGMAADGSILPSKHDIVVDIGAIQGKGSAVELMPYLTPGPYRLMCDDHAVVAACLFLKRHSDLALLEESGPFSFQVEPEMLIGEADTYDGLVALVPKMRDLCRDLLILQEYGALDVAADTTLATKLAGSCVAQAEVCCGDVLRAIARGVAEDAAEAWYRFAKLHGRELGTQPTIVRADVSVADSFVALLANMTSLDRERHWQQCDREMRAFAQMAQAKYTVLAIEAEESDRLADRDVHYRRATRYAKMADGGAL